MQLWKDLALDETGKSLLGEKNPLSVHIKGASLQLKTGEKVKGQVIMCPFESFEVSIGPLSLTLWLSAT